MHSSILLKLPSCLVKNTLLSCLMFRVLEFCALFKAFSGCEWKKACTSAKLRLMEGQRRAAPCQEVVRSLRYVGNAAANPPQHKGHWDLISDTCLTCLHKH